MVRRLLILATPLAFLGASCGPDALGLMPGVINDPGNLSLRRDLLARAQPAVCAEVQGRSLPIRARDDLGAIGRFVPLSCNAAPQAPGELALQLAGRGYVWTAMSQRLGFEASAAVVYDVDFLLDGATMYLYLRPKGPPQARFATRLVEQPGASFFGGQGLADGFGAQIMTGQLSRGLTVIRKPDGTMDVAVGVIPPGARPLPGITRLPPSTRLLVNDRSELRAGQRDFIPITVPPRAAVTLLMGVEGAPAVDVLLVPRQAGDTWLAAYAGQAAPTPPPAPPLFDEAVPAGALYRRTIPVPPGAYYLVLDNTAAAGKTAPGPSTDRPIVVSYAVQLD